MAHPAVTWADPDTLWEGLHGGVNTKRQTSWDQGLGSWLPQTAMIYPMTICNENLSVLSLSCLSDSHGLKSPQVNPGSLQSTQSSSVLTAIYFPSHILLLPSYYLKLQLYQTLWSLGFCLSHFLCLESPYFYHVVHLVSSSSFQPSSYPALRWEFLSSSGSIQGWVWPLYTDSEHTLSPFTSHSIRRISFGVWLGFETWLCSVLNDFRKKEKSKHLLNFQRASCCLKHFLRYYPIPSYTFFPLGKVIVPPWILANLLITWDYFQIGSGHFHLSVPCTQHLLPWDTLCSVSMCLFLCISIGIWSHLYSLRAGQP